MGKLNRTSPNLFLRTILPLWAHKIDSDNAGKHEWWPKRAHTIAEIAAIGADLAINSVALYFLLKKKNPKLALTTKTLYQTGVSTVPHPISKISNTILKRQVSL